MHVGRPVFLRFPSAPLAAAAGLLLTAVLFAGMRYLENAQVEREFRTLAF